MTRYGTKLGTLSSLSSKSVILKRKEIVSEKRNSNLKETFQSGEEFIQRRNEREFSSGRRK